MRKLAVETLAHMGDQGEVYASAVAKRLTEDDTLDVVVATFTALEKMGLTGNLKAGYDDEAPPWAENPGSDAALRS